MNSDRDAASSKQELDALTAAFFRAVSFREGEKPAYSDLYTLFIESAYLIKNSATTPEISTVRQFIEPRQRMVDTGELLRFEEVETAEITEIFGNVAHRFSTYAKEGISMGTPIAARGVISTQFIMTPEGWRISCMAWDDERPGLTIPERDHYTGHQSLG